MEWIFVGLYRNNLTCLCATPRSRINWCHSLYLNSRNLPLELTQKKTITSFYLFFQAPFVYSVMVLVTSPFTSASQQDVNWVSAQNYNRTCLFATEMKHIIAEQRVQNETECQKVVQVDAGKWILCIHGQNLPDIDPSSIAYKLQWLHLITRCTPMCRCT